MNRYTSIRVNGWDDTHFRKSWIDDLYTVSKMEIQGGTKFSNIVNADELNSDLVQRVIRALS